MAKVELIVPAHAKKGKASELKAVLRTLVMPTRAEEGNEFYHLYESETEGHFFFHELWKSQEALDQHMRAPHFTDATGKMKPLLDGDLEINKVTDIS